MCAKRHETLKFLQSVSRETKHLSIFDSSYGVFRNFSAERHAVRLALQQEQPVKNERPVENTSKFIGKKRKYTCNEQGLLHALSKLVETVVPYHINLLETRRIILVGSRFSGKTSWIQLLANTLATHQQWEGNESCLLPIHIDLQHFEVDDIKLDKESSHLTYDLLSRYIMKRHGGDWSMYQFVRSEIKEERYWLLLDNLDKCSKNKQNKIFNWLRWYLDDIAPNLRCVVSTSSYQTRNQIQQLRLCFSTWHLRPLDTCEGTKLVRNCFDSAACNAKDNCRVKPPHWIKDELRRSENAIFLKNPLLTYLYAMILIEQLSDLQSKQAVANVCPFQRVELFRCTTWKLLNWVGDCGRAHPSRLRIEQDRNLTSASTLLELLETLAYITHAKESSSLSKQDLYEAARYCCSPGKSLVLAEQLYENLCNNSCTILVWQDHDIVAETKEEIEVNTSDANDNLSASLYSQETLTGLSPNTNYFVPDVNFTDIANSTGSRRFLFIHKAMQEHLAAEYIAKKFQDEAKVIKDINYNENLIHERISFLVDKYLVGHFIQEQYRVSRQWWHPVIISVLDILKGSTEENYAMVSEDENNGFNMFDTVVTLLVRRCLIGHNYNATQQLPISLEKLWLAAVSTGSMDLVSGLIHNLGISKLLLTTDEEENNALHLAALNNRPEVIKLLMSKQEVDLDYLDRNNKYGWDPSNMAMVYNNTKCFRLLCTTDGDKVAENDSIHGRPAIITASMNGDFASVKALIQAVSKRVNICLECRVCQNENEDGPVPYVRTSLESRPINEETIQRVLSPVKKRRKDRTNSQATISTGSIIEGNSNSFFFRVDESKDPLSENQSTNLLSPTRHRKREQKLMHMNAKFSLPAEQEFDEVKFQENLENIPQVSNKNPNLSKRETLKSVISESPKAQNGTVFHCPLHSKEFSRLNFMENSSFGGDLKESCYYASVPEMLNAKGSSGMTAAMWAARKGYADILKELIENGADVVNTVAGGITTLLFAVECGNIECVRILLEAGANALDLTPDNDSALLCACSFGFDEIAISLIENGACALEALVVSCVQGKDTTVLSLVESSLVDINSVWEDLMVSPLAGACVTGHLSTCQLLLSLGADPNLIIDVEYGSTPLMLAVHMGNIDVVRVMLEAGANVNAISPENSQCSRSYGECMTAVKIARINNHRAVELLLRSYGGCEYIPVDLTYFSFLDGRFSDTSILSIT